jgi:hypothetical protein
MLRPPKLDLVTCVFLGLVALGGIVYTAFELTPSSYGIVLDQIGAPEDGPILGEPRVIRADEWAMTTPFFQAAVANGFRRVNQSSFYQEDLRGQSIPIGLPLKDWGLVFKPQLWAFFFAPPAIAYSFFWALMLCGSLAGYQLLLRQLGLQPLFAAAASVMIVFSAFVQFWWTTFIPVIAGLPWILLILFSSLRWWHKALLFSWVLPVWVMADIYPTLLVELAFFSVILILALRPSLLRSPGDLAAVAIGGTVMLVVVYAYYVDIIPLMRNTVYPGHRVAGPGDASVTAVLGEFFPFVSFRFRDYGNLSGSNVCEVSAVGSFLPLLTLCLMRYRALWNDRFARRAVIILLVAFALTTFWAIGPAPTWIGLLLLWSIGPATRLLLTSGFLLMTATLVIWGRKLISVHPARLLIFILAGPILSLLLKVGYRRMGFEDSISDLALSGLLLIATLIACYVPARARTAVLVSAFIPIHLYAFGLFNPVQSAGPIFDVPETNIVKQLRVRQETSPDHSVIDLHFGGAVLNGLGFRSVAHALMTPRLDVFRQYFPAMDAGQFNYVFNRFSEFLITEDRLPNVPYPQIVNLPMQAFEPIRNLRQVAVEAAARKDCSIQRGGAVDRFAAEGDHVTIEGWAPWPGEDKSQELSVISARALQATLLTVRRPDVSEKMKDYAFTRAGFRLTLSSSDGKPLRVEEVVLVARNTIQGLAELTGCGCP